MRNEEAVSSFNRPMIEWLFDAEDKTSEIDTAQRTELVLAYISNRAAQRSSHLAEESY